MKPVLYFSSANWFYVNTIEAQVKDREMGGTMSGQFQPITAEQVLAQWAAAQGESSTADLHCSYCLQPSQQWLNHWRSGEVLNICDHCYLAMTFSQCSVCLGVGTSYDMALVHNR